jgi:hypothetical protein
MLLETPGAELAERTKATMKMVVQRKETLKLRHVCVWSTNSTHRSRETWSPLSQKLVRDCALVVVSEWMCRAWQREQTAMKLGCPVSWKTQGEDYKREL